LIVIIFGLVLILLISIIMYIIFTYVLTKYSNYFDKNDKFLILFGSISGAMISVLKIILLISENEKFHFVYLIAWLSLILYLIYALLSLVREKRKELFSMVSFLIPSAFIVIFCLIPDKIIEFQIKEDFLRNYNHYQEAINFINKNSKKEEFITLPLKYQKLTVDGKIEIFRKNDVLNVIFYIFYGNYNLYSGILYTTKDRTVLINELELNTVKLKPNWYIVYGDFHDRLSK